MSELIQKLKQQSEKRKEQHERKLSDLENRYDELRNRLLEHKEERNKSEDALNNNLEKLQSVIGDLTNKKVGNGIPVSSDNHQSFEGFLKESMLLVGKVSSGMDCSQESCYYPDFSNGIVERMVSVQESSKEIKRNTDSVEKAVDNTNLIIMNNEDENVTDESMN